jgi:hypothetical protein
MVKSLLLKGFMRKLALLLSLLASSFVTPALAAGGAAPMKTEPTIPLAPVAVPVTHDGRLVNYIFISIKVVLSPKADLITLSGKEPYFRDVLVRAAHRQNLMAAGDPNRVNEALVRSILMRETASFMDPRLIARVDIVRQDPRKFLSRDVLKKAGTTKP